MVTPPVRRNMARAQDLWFAQQRSKNTADLQERHNAVHARHLLLQWWENMSTASPLVRCSVARA